MENRKRVGHPSRLVVTGSLAPWAEGFREDLTGKGYAPHSISGQMALMAHLSVWLEGQSRSAHTLDSGTAAEYLRARRGEGHRKLTGARSMEPVLAYLRGVGAVPGVVPPAGGSPAESLLEEFGSYLVSERGLAPASVRSYLDHARPFLAGLAGPGGRAPGGG